MAKSSYQFSDLTEMYPPFGGTLPQAGMLPQATPANQARLSMLSGAPKPTRDQVRVMDPMGKLAPPVALSQRTRVISPDEVLYNGSLLPPDVTAPHTTAGDISKPAVWM